MSAKAKGQEIADKWGPALTKMMVDGDMSDFKDIFVQDEPVYTVLQDAEGHEIETSIGTDGELSWDAFQELSSKDLASQNFDKIEAQCLGVLGDRMIMETGRFNKDGVVYLEAYSLLTIDGNGKVTMVEAFADSQLTSVQAAVTKTEE
eukprot:CAMPEP_0117029426 /NCGR_PEP_ID=MMETSP0472-20121206/21311_1 /TAXON_ID=693140 ORGANISM="Tiarina fusus, Strain LIS" /NCGR_SAMPLE_ID=MMETSP0472 /ASSEMBLY_ACC=CAM_ASM_000603 /LENGTH=147 /DNA_ID=CAMNT_0004737193 /DNA_START=113 /DNA_END=556 /DNA_ORIENTATION=+